VASVGFKNWLTAVESRLIRRQRSEPTSGGLTRGSNDAERDRLVANIVGHLLDGVTEPVLERAFEYFRNVEKDLGDRVEKGVRGG
jgi:catalase